MMQDVMYHNREGRNEGVHGVSLADFLNTRPLPFASAPEPIDTKVAGHREKAQHRELQ
jgi:hypothetical protein